jgi:hypothetical protein
MTSRRGFIKQLAAVAAAPVALELAPLITDDVQVFADRVLATPLVLYFDSPGGSVSDIDALFFSLEEVARIFAVPAVYLEELIR